MGKRNKVLWEYYQATSVINKFRCSFCSAEFKKNATRQVRHLLKCKKVPKDVRSQLLDNDKNQEDTSFNLEGASNNPSSTSSNLVDTLSIELDPDPVNDASLCVEKAPITISNVTPTFSSMKSSSMLNFVDIMRPNEQKIIDELLARAIFVSGAPLSLTKNSAWIDLFKKLRPSYEVPSRYQLSNPLLSLEYHRVEERVLAQIAGASILTLQTDAWSNIRRDSITNYVINTPKPVFYKSTHTKENRHMAKFLFEEIEAVLKDVGVYRFIGIITDNGANIKAARKMVNKNYSHITEYGCICHGLNLLIVDIFKIQCINRLKSSVIRMVSEIKNSHILHATFERIQRDRKSQYIALKLPVQTRWNSFVISLSSLIETRYALKALAIEDEVQSVMKASTISSILSETFWKKVETVHCLLSPIAKWTSFFENDKKAVLSKVVDCFVNIKQSFEQNKCANYEELISILASRAEKCLQPLHYAANLLEPCSRGNNLSESQKLEATEFIFNIAEFHPKYNEGTKIIESLAHYNVRSELFSRPFVVASEQLSGEIWWAGVCSTSPLSALAVDILNMPASTAATERTFSSYGFIHSQKRNRLTIERAGKLTYILHSFNLSKSDTGTLGNEDEAFPAESNADQLVIDEAVYSFEEEEEEGNLEETMNTSIMDEVDAEDDNRVSGDDLHNGLIDS